MPCEHGLHQVYAQDDLYVPEVVYPCLLQEEHVAEENIGRNCVVLLEREEYVEDDDSCFLAKQQRQKAFCQNWTQLAAP